MLIRRIAPTTEWNVFVDSGTSVATFAIVKDFFEPQLSVFEVDDEFQALRVAAALCMTHSAGATRCLFACVEDEAFKKTGIKLKKTPGETKLPDVDQMHRDAIISNEDELRGIINVFKEGSNYDFSKLEVETCIKMLFQDGQYNIAEISKAKDVKPPIAAGLLRAINTSILQISV